MFQHMNIQQLSELMDSDAPLHIVDVRDPQSFAQGRITHAQALDNSNVQGFIEHTPKSEPVVVCCYHGNSSQSAAQFLTEQGFSEVYSLDGGFEMWKVSQPDKVEV